MHPLSSSCTNINNKSVLYVKLTDSALESFEQIARLKGSDKESPTIQLRNSGGVLVVPRAGQQPHTFSFSISNQQDDSSYQCLKTTDHGLESMGTMRETIRVRANEDVYSRTIQRQQEAKRQNEAKTTKLLENKDKKRLGLPSPSSIALKTQSVKTLAGGPPPPTRHYHPPNSGAVPPAVSRHYPASSAPPPPPVSRHYAPSSAAFSSTEPHNSGPGRGGGGQLPSFTSGSSRHHPPPSSSSVPHTEKHSVNKYEIKKCHPSNKPSLNPEIMKRPLRERLIHLLAVKPYKKPELLPRLNRDGLREKDKKNVMSVLGDVAKNKNNSYELKRSVWHDVNEDWPYYTESDKAALRRRKPQNLTPPGSDNGSTSSGHSPSSTNPPSPPQITNPLKRQSYYEQGSSDTSKKKRVSHYKRPPAAAASDQPTNTFARSPYSLLGSSPGGMLGSPSMESSQRNMERLDLGSSSTFVDTSAPDWAQFRDDSDHRPPSSARSSPLQTLHNRSSPAALPSSCRRSPAVGSSAGGGRSVGSSPAGQRSWTLEESTTGAGSSSSQEGASPPLNIEAHFQNNNQDFLTEYTPITSAVQRAQYKVEFRTFYNKYITYHDILATVKTRFQLLENRRQQARRGSQEYERIKVEIQEEFSRNSQDAQWQEARRNFQYLHEKLNHLKNLVHAYDTNQ